MPSMQIFMLPQATAQCIANLKAIVTLNGSVIVTCSSAATPLHATTQMISFLQWQSDMSLCSWMLSMIVGSPLVGASGSNLQIN